MMGARRTGYSLGRHLVLGLSLKRTANVADLESCSCAFGLVDSVRPSTKMVRRRQISKMVCFRRSGWSFECLVYRGETCSAPLEDLE